jgi:hypothetical protein
VLGFFIRRTHMMDLKSMMGGGSDDADTATKRDVLQEIIAMCKEALGKSVGKKDPSRMPKEQGGTETAEVISDKPKAMGTDEEEDDEKEYLKRFGGGES